MLVNPAPQGRASTSFIALRGAAAAPSWLGSTNTRPQRHRVATRFGKVSTTSARRSIWQFTRSQEWINQT